MKVAFPYMGTIHVALSGVLRQIGAVPVVPPAPNRRTLQLGARHAPEAMCIPFKLTLGHMMLALRAGADTLAYVSGSWSCRFGYYGRMQADILREQGFRFRLLELRHDRLTRIAREIVGLNGGSWARATVATARALRLGWHKSTAVDKAEQAARSILPYAANVRDIHRVRADVLHRIDATDSVRALRHLGSKLTSAYEQVIRRERQSVPIVKLIGESFCTLEPFINFEIEERIGAMGCLVDPFLTAHRWLGFHGFRIGSGELRQSRRTASRAWRRCVGGEDENSVRHLISAARAGYDGVIHIHPFGCMPSTVVHPVMAKLSREMDIPFISLSVDEHTSELGLATRLEGFVELLRRRKALSRTGPRAFRRDSGIGT